MQSALNFYLNPVIFSWNSLSHFLSENHFVSFYFKTKSNSISYHSKITAYINTLIIKIFNNTDFISNYKISFIFVSQFRLFQGNLQPLLREKKMSFHNHHFVSFWKVHSHFASHISLPYSKFSSTRFSLYLHWSCLSK